MHTMPSQARTNRLGIVRETHWGIIAKKNRRLAAEKKRAEQSSHSALSNDDSRFRDVVSSKEQAPDICEFCLSCGFSYRPNSADCVALQVARGCHSCKRKDCHASSSKCPHSIPVEEPSVDDDEVCKLCESFAVRYKVNSVDCIHIQSTFGCHACQGFGCWQTRPSCPALNVNTMWIEQCGQHLLSQCFVVLPCKDQAIEAVAAAAHRCSTSRNALLAVSSSFRSDCIIIIRVRFFLSRNF